MGHAGSGVYVLAFVAVVVAHRRTVGRLRQVTATSVKLQPTCKYHRHPSAEGTSGGLDEYKTSCGIPRGPPPYAPQDLPK